MSVSVSTRLRLTYGGNGPRTRLLAACDALSHQSHAHRRLLGRAIEEDIAEDLVKKLLVDQDVRKLFQLN